MEEKYTELVVATREEFIEIVADFIGTYTNEAVEFGQDRVVLRTTQDTESLEKELEKLDDSLELKVTKETKENIDWIKKYQDSIEPIDVGEFYVYPSWYPPKEGKINILINPALAFGSGHHATTYSCLQVLSEVVHEGNRLLDVGCGSGILALAARFKGATVDLCDTDPLAVDSAKENFELNDASFNDIWEGSANKGDKEYDIVVANIIADVLKMIAPELKSRVKSGGNLIVSGILDKKERIVTDAFSDMEIVKRIQRDEWVTIQYKG